VWPEGLGKFKKSPHQVSNPQLHEHRHNFKDGVLGESKLVQNVYKECHRVIWDEARIVEIESNNS
jgi:hypothetical protein